MNDQSLEKSPSGNPRWKAEGPRLPTVAAPPFSAGSTEQAHVAWGWSPTEWRALLVAAGRR